MGLGAFFGVTKAPKVPCGDGTTSLPQLLRPWICMLCQQTSPKRWFANVNMASCCGVTNSVYPGTMTTIRHCSILEFGRKASNQAGALSITRALHTTGWGWVCKTRVIQFSLLC